MAQGTPISCSLGSLKLVLVLLGIALTGYSGGPPLCWQFMEGLKEAASCSPRVCDCPSESACFSIIPPGLSNLCLSGLNAETCAPPPAVQCNSDGCEVWNYQGIWQDRGRCKSAKVMAPKSEAEILEAVGDAVKKKQKIRVVSILSHSLSNLVCVGTQGLIISTENYASVISIDKIAMTITVQAGAMMSDVIEEAAKDNLTLPAMTYWNGVSAAGVISTGAHGSGLSEKGSGVYEYVVGMRLIVPASSSHGYAKVVTLTEGDPELNAAKISLGTLGVISEITFALEPMFKRSVSAILKDDSVLDNETESFLRAHEYTDIYWFPSHGKALFRNMCRVSVDVPGDGVSIIIGTPFPVAAIEGSAAETAVAHANGDANRVCFAIEALMLSTAVNGSGFLSDGQRFTGYPVVGFNHRMQASGGCQGPNPGHEDQPNTCTSDEILDKHATVCPWDRRIRTTLKYDVELVVPMSRVRAAIGDIKKIRDLDPQRLCDLRGILLRSIKKSDAYLGPPEDVVAIEMIYYRPTEAMTPKWNEDVFQEIEQMVVEKHGARMHWGKSGGYLFQGLGKRTTNFTRFLDVKERFDPQGVFSNDWTDAVFGIGGKVIEQWRDGCALDKMCKCSEDRHCAPDKGYFCQPGRVWQNSRVCRKKN